MGRGSDAKKRKETPTSTDKQVSGQTNHRAREWVFKCGNVSRNRSPKGNMWSVIPVALLCMIVNWSERKQGSSPKRDEVL